MKYFLIAALLLPGCAESSDPTVSSRIETSALEEVDLLAVLDLIHNAHPWVDRPGPIYVDLKGREVQPQFPKALELFGMALVDGPISDHYDTGNAVVSSTWEHEGEYVSVTVTRYALAMTSWQEYRCMKFDRGWWISRGSMGLGTNCKFED